MAGWGTLGGLGRIGRAGAPWMERMRSQVLRVGEGGVAGLHEHLRLGQFSHHLTGSLPLAR